MVLGGKRNNKHYCLQVTVCIGLTMESSIPSKILNVIKSAESKTTNYKTQSDIRKFKSFIRSDGDDREIEHIPDDELDILISRFLITVKSNQGEDYEPTTLKGFQGSIQRYLRSKGGTWI